jgi:1-deoxy-D-xylulose-5-phosphate reductoisomerase
MKKIGILGSTGSIGKSAIALLANELKEDFEVEFLSFHSNAELAFQQAIQVGAKEVIATSKEGYENLLKLANGVKFKIQYGEDALKEACKREDVEVMLIAIVGVVGLDFTLASILPNAKRVIAIANKESIVCGFHLINQKLALSKNTTIIPVDSEHNSLFRLLLNVESSKVESVFITASGGPFYGKKFKDLADVKIRDVVSHPTWNMGAKISVDSATMANKGLELIEAYNLFGFLNGKIKTFIARGSLLHAGINFVDGASHWFLSKPDMKTHISNAILNGNIKALNLSKIDLSDLQNLQFDEIREDEFPIFFIAQKVAKNGGILGAISFNILNEIAVSQFLESKIKYTDILKIIQQNLFYNPSNYTFNSGDEIKNYYNEVRNKLAIKK